MEQNKLVYNTDNKYPDSKDPWIGIDKTSILWYSVRLISNRCRSEGLCYLSTPYISSSSATYGVFHKELQYMQSMLWKDPTAITKDSQKAQLQLQKIAKRPNCNYKR